ncbi:MAG: CHAD domain-containing protein [Verrucomicrobiota bacterium]
MKRAIPTQLADLLATRLEAARRRYRKRLGRCQEKFSEKAVHNLRIETRQILALLDLLSALEPQKSSEKAAKQFEKRLKLFGEVRDAQVQLILLKPMWPKFPEASSLKTFLERREEKLIRKLAAKIRSTPPSHLNHRLKAIVKHLRHQTESQKHAGAAEAATKVLRTVFQNVEVLRRKVQPEQIASIHQMRIAFKRFRYLSELLQPLLPNLTDAQLERMKAYQAIAGDIQDTDVLLHRLAQAVKHRKLNPAALRNLRGELLRQRHRAIDFFMTRIDDLNRFRAVVRPARKTHSH